MVNPTHPEWQLLINCLQPQPSSQGIPPHLHWETVLNTAQWHKILPRLYLYLQAQEWENVPDAVRSQLTQKFHQNLQHNCLLTTHLCKISQRFQTHGLPFLPFKGILLSQQLNGHLAHRTIYDLDFLLTSPQDYYKAKELLAQEDYRTYHNLTPQQETRQLTSNFGAVFLHPPTLLQVDIHWGLHPPFFTCHIPPQDLLSRQQQIKIGRYLLPTLSPEDQLLILCVNGGKDCWTELQRIGDIGQCLQHFPHLDWETLLTRSQTYRCYRILLLGCNLAHELLHSPLPPVIADPIKKTPIIAKLTQQVLQQWQNTVTPTPTTLQQSQFCLQLQDGLLNQIHYLLHLLLPINERDVGWVHLPRFLFPLYYPLRFLRLVMKHTGLTD